MTEIELLKDQLRRAKLLQYNDNATLDDIRRKGQMALENILPIKNYDIDIWNIEFAKGVYIENPEMAYRKDWKEGRNELVNLLDTAIKDHELTISKQG